MGFRDSFIARLSAFLTSHDVGRGEFGLLVVGDRDFVRDLEVGKNVRVDRIETADAFMVACEADPAHLAAARANRGGQAGMPKPLEKVRQRAGGVR